MCSHQSKLSRHKDFNLFDKLADLTQSKLESCSAANWKQVYLLQIRLKATLFTTWGIVFLKNFLEDKIYVDQTLISSTKSPLIFSQKNITLGDTE